MADEPKWLIHARRQVGLKEIGNKKGQWLQDNPFITEYWRRAGILKQGGDAWLPGNDETPWCAAFVGAMLADAGLKGTGSALARSYETWGEPVMTGEGRFRWASIPLGGIVVLNRPSAGPKRGHVGFATAAADKTVRLIGGNQNDRVGEDWFPKSRIVAVRWPTGEPASPYLLNTKAPAAAGRARTR